MSFSISRPLFGTTSANPAQARVTNLQADALKEPFTTHLTTGDAMVNKLWNIIQWGQRSNFAGVPTDCPQRDERLGWTADAQVFWRTATFNMDLTTFSQKFAADIHGTQATTPMYGIYAPGLDTPNPGFGAAWSDAGVIIPWTGWIHSGNPRIIDQNWDGMEQYLAEILVQNPNHLWQRNFGAAFGDWLTPTITTPEDLLATARINATDLTLEGKPLDTTSLQPGPAPGDLLLSAGTYTVTATLLPATSSLRSTETADARH